MATTYRTGYGDTRRTLTELRAWDPFEFVSPELQRRLIALMDHSFRHGRDIGIGGGFRSSAAQRAVFLDRHYTLPSGGCCGFESRRYQIKSGQAHTAPPGLSYHEETLAGRALAVDITGWEDGWVQSQLAAFGLRSFNNLTGSAKEPWHIQPIEIPTSRASYNPAVHVLKTWYLPPPTAPDPDYPKPTLKVGATGNEVYELQQHCTFWGWYNRAIDGSFGAITADAVKKMQATLKQTQDGVYGNITANAYLNWLKAIQKL